MEKNSDLKNGEKNWGRRGKVRVGVKGLEDSSDAKRGSGVLRG